MAKTNPFFAKNPFVLAFQSEASGNLGFLRYSYLIWHDIEVLLCSGKRKVTDVAEQLAPFRCYPKIAR